MTKFLSILLLAISTVIPARGLLMEDVPLESCDKLPVLQVKVSGMRFLFLVDTAATSMLNLNSFSRGDASSISVTSWNGTRQTHAQEVTLADFAVGEHHIKLLKLPAIDLSSIGHACGRRIDGILGIDLLSRLKATVDLENNTAHLSAEAASETARVGELHQQLMECEAAFNRADEASFAECLAPSVVVFTASGDYYGREASMAYYRHRYFQHDPPAHLSITPRAHHAIGDAIWVEYDLRIALGQQTILARGTALCEKSQGRWRIVHMNHSTPPPAVQTNASE
ncbi:MAG TPA: nuclear transport factor 2 family protein [Candidatus Angelobacter sp.]|jgi:ketosteroid isomerase-like protein|nr:nuclear transport factor 2 family protein [Candidatus Angelobacter sp.]HKT51736.1 nuclear transport factor 2 family protein [Candidatus Angelobacter sp.]